MPIFLGHQAGKHSAAWSSANFLKDLTALAAEQPKHRLVR